MSEQIRVPSSQPIAHWTKPAKTTGNESVHFKPRLSDNFLKNSIIEPVHMAPFGLALEWHLPDKHTGTVFPIMEVRDDNDHPPGNPRHFSQH